MLPNLKSPPMSEWGGKSHITGFAEIAAHFPIPKGVDHRNQEEHLTALTPDQVVALNTPLAVHMAMRAAARIFGGAIEPQDLVQEGLIAIDHAHREFDPAKSSRLSTSATYKIRGRHTNALRKDLGIRVPDSARDAFAEVWRTYQELVQAGTPCGVGDVTDAVNAKRASQNRNPMQAKRVREVLSAPKVTDRLSQTVTRPGFGGEKFTLSDVLPASSKPNVVNPYTQPEYDEWTRHLETSLECLSPIERAAINLKFGLSDHPLVESVTAISRLLEVSESTAKNAITRALAKLSTNPDVIELMKKKPRI